ncbi:NACHT domain-containing protein, partial [Triangularia verruculosa]
MFLFTVGQVVFLVAQMIAFYLFLRRLAQTSSSSPSPAQSSSEPDQRTEVHCGSRAVSPAAGEPATATQKQSRECPASCGQPPSPPLIQTKGVILRQVHPPPHIGTETDVDIIAIHGLDTKSPDTWVWQAKGVRVNWLEDAHMLPQRCPTARIFTCDWPADLLEQPDFIQKTIEEFARLLLAGISNRPAAPNDPPGKDDRPIVFIASCLGGIVLMKALVMATDEYLCVRQATRGIVFLATPFRGTSFEHVAKWAEPGLRAWASVRAKKVSNLLEHVNPTFKLGELVRRFTGLCRKNALIDHVFTFYETGNSSLPRKVVSCLPAFLSQEQPLVNQQSATLDFVPHPLPLDRPHILMNKFCGPDDTDYVSVAGKMATLLAKVRSGRPIEKADAWIRKTRYSRKQLQIERLSGGLLPMDQCYINLAIVERPGDNVARGEEGDTAQQSSPFSLLARLKLETPDEEIEVKLSNLLEPRKTRDGQTRRPRRILIRGRAGVGKTTLCKKIVYEFTCGTMWADLFDRVLWVPLRNLKQAARREDPGYNFGDLFRDEYFSQHPERSKLAEALWGALQDTESGRTLFILDGLDEVLQELHGVMSVFFAELLNQLNVIITARPNALLPPQLDPLDLEMETIGFYPDQITAYIESAFTDREKCKRNLENIEEVQSFLQRHPLMQGLMRIPIQLDAFCYTWNGFPRKAVPETMTAVYRDIEESLWKKDAVKLDKLTQGRMHVAHRSEISKSVKHELYLLEFLAFTGMHNDVIDFEQNHRDAISEHFKLCEIDFLLDEILGSVSFLRTSDTSLDKRDRNYHFLHLTFQEYFAARYFTRQWATEGELTCLKLSNGEGQPMQPTAFLQKYKYDARYNIMWRFVAGLLDDTAGKKTRRFFQTIEEEPRDLLGPTHQRLVMHCLSEVERKKSTFTEFREKLENQLEQWLLFEYDFTGNSTLAREMECPEQVLINALTQASKDARTVLLESLSRRTAVPSSIIQLVSPWLTNRAFKRQYIAILLILRNQHNSLPNKIQQGIAARLEDKDRDVRRAAIRALQGRADLPEQMLQGIAARLEHEDWDVRQAAIEALQGRADLPEQMLQGIAARLEHEVWDVRQA